MLQKLVDEKFPRLFISGGKVFKEGADKSLSAQEIVSNQSISRDIISELSGALLQENPKLFYQVWEKTL